MNKEETIKNIFKLLDACTQCRQIFHGSIEPAYKELVDKIEQKIDQFGIELRNEMRRLGEINPGPFRFERIPSDSEILALRRALDYYAQVLKASIPTRTLAMIARQHSELERAYQHLLDCNERPESG